jgi:hypothetical protein
MGEITVFDVPLEGWFAVIAVLIILLFVLWSIAVFRIGRLKKRLQAFVKDTGATDLEGVMKKLHAQAEELYGAKAEQERRLEQLEKKITAMKGNVNVLRYNAFGDGGSDLSFSLAIVNDRADGVVLSALHSRDESRVYAKPLEGGASTYSLTPEEKEVVIQAKRRS